MVQQPPPPLALFVAALALEGLYLLGRTILLARFTEPVTRELAWTLWRIPFCVAYWFIAGRAARSFALTEKLHPLVLIAVPLAAALSPGAAIIDPAIAFYMHIFAIILILAWYGFSPTRE